MRYCCFKQKVIVNVIEGKQLGYITDLFLFESGLIVCALAVFLVVYFAVYRKMPVSYSADAE